MQPTNHEVHIQWLLNHDVHIQWLLIRRNKDLIKELSTPPPGSKDLYFPTQYSQYFYTQCMACLWKQRLSYWRNPPYTAVRFLFTTFIALMFGTIFWDLGTKRYKCNENPIRKAACLLHMKGKGKIEGRLLKRKNVKFMDIPLILNRIKEYFSNYNDKISTFFNKH